MNYIIISSKSDYTSDFLLKLDRLDGIRVVTDKEVTAKNINISRDDKFYIPSDTVYETISEHFDHYWHDLIDNFRNKYKFRKLFSPINKDFFFDKIILDDLDKYIFDFKRREKYVVKPSIGFMAGGVKIITANSNLLGIKKDIQRELEKYSNIYPNIFSNELLIEQYIGDGEEYAIDMYYDKIGRPVIINIYCHPISRRKEYSQLLYFSNKKIFNKMYDMFIDYFTELNSDHRIKSFPIHAEFKLDQKTLMPIPIEFNSCRFGGMGVADLTYYSFGFNPFLFFFDDDKPEWKAIWDRFSFDDYFCWILAYNTADLDIKIHKPNYLLFKRDIIVDSELKKYIPLNYKRFPAFAIVYLKTQNKRVLTKILDLEFNNYFKKDIY